MTRRPGCGPTSPSTLSNLLRSLLILFVGSASAAAADLRVVAPSPPGSGWDQLAQAMKTTLTGGERATSIEVINVPGGSGSVGLGQFLSNASGGDILVTGLTMLDSMLVKHSPIALDQLTPIARLTAEHFVLVVPATSPIRSIADFKAAFQTEPSKLTWAGGPVGGVDHTAAALLAMASGVAPAALNYVAFVTSGDAVAATVEGRVTAAFLSAVELGAAMAAGQVRPLAIASDARLPRVAAPTFRESGLDLEFANWRGLVARPGLEAGEIASIEKVVQSLVASPRWREQIESRGWEEAYLPAATFLSFIKAEKARMKAALKATGSLKPPLN